MDKKYFALYLLPFRPDFAFTIEDYPKNFGINYILPKSNINK